MKARRISAAAAALALFVGLCGTARAWDGITDAAKGVWWGGGLDRMNPAPAVKGVAAQAPEVVGKEFDTEAKAAVARRIEAEEGNGAYAVLTALRVDPPSRGYLYTHVYEARVVLTTFAGPDRSGERSDLEYKYFGFYDSASKEASVARREPFVEEIPSREARAEQAAARMRELVAQAKAEGGHLKFIREVSLEKDFLRRPRLKLLAERPEHRKEREKFEMAVDWSFSCDSSWHCDPEERPMMGFGIGYRIEYIQD